MSRPLVIRTSRSLPKCEVDCRLQSARVPFLGDSAATEPTRWSYILHVVTTRTRVTRRATPRRSILYIMNSLRPQRGKEYSTDYSRVIGDRTGRRPVRTRYYRFGRSVLEYYSISDTQSNIIENILGGRCALTWLGRARSLLLGLLLHHHHCYYIQPWSPRRTSAHATIDHALQSPTAVCSAQVYFPALLFTPSSHPTA